VLAALGRALGVGPYGPVPPCPSDHAPGPSEPSPPLHLRPLGRYSSGARGTTAVRAGALELSVNGLIDTTFGCYPSSNPPMLCPKGHQPSVGTHTCTACHLADALKCCNFRPAGLFGITLRAGCVMGGTVGAFPHCHWLSRTLYGTGQRMASCWT
jgi:hypothetical protein